MLSLQTSESVTQRIECVAFATAEVVDSLSMVMKLIICWHFLNVRRTRHEVSFFVSPRDYLFAVMRADETFVRETNVNVVVVYATSSLRPSALSLM